MVMGEMQCCYHHPNDDSFTLDEIAEPGQPGWQVDYREYTSTFTDFT